MKNKLLYILFSFCFISTCFSQTDVDIFNLDQLTSPADGDYLWIVDLSDTTDNANGTAKKVELTDIFQTYALGRNLIPESDSTYNLGSSSVRWANIYADNLDLTNLTSTNLLFEGSTEDENETTLTVSDPDADRTITLPNATGTVSLVAGTETLINKTIDADDNTFSDIPAEIGIAISDESTDLTTGTAKVTFRMPYAMTLTAVRASVNTAPVGSTIIFDVNESGTTVLSTRLTIDASEETSESAATEEVISDSSLADDAEITIDIDQIGSSTAGKGAKIWLIGTRSY